MKFVTLRAAYIACRFKRLEAGQVTPWTQTFRVGGLAVHGRQANEIARPAMQAWFA